MEVGTLYMKLLCISCCNKWSERISIYKIDILLLIIHKIMLRTKLYILLSFQIKNHLDMRNFDRYPPDREPILNDFSDWDTYF